MTTTGRTESIPSLPIDYGEVVGDELQHLEAALASLPLDGDSSGRWLALRLLEGEPTTVGAVTGVPGGRAVVARAEAAADRIRATDGIDPSLLIADRRYGWVHDLAAGVVQREVVPRSRTDRIDDVLTNRLLGVPVFLLLMWVVFTIVTDVADPFVGWIEQVIGGPVRGWGAGLLGLVGLRGTWVEGLLLDGILAGVGAVLVFVPVLTVLYVALGVLEDSGYMARAAYLMDRVMSPIGLSGKSFLPLLLGFGCNVPGVYATRVLDRRRDRVITALLMPFVSCAARLPVYVLLASVFFPRIRGTVVFGMYILSFVMVLVLGTVLDRLLLRSERSSSFVLELPPYRRPSFRVLGSYVSQRVGAFVRNAGTVILLAAMAVWLLLAIPVAGGGSFDDTDLEDSAFAATSATLAPALAPAGLGNWEMTGTLLTGTVAKEVVIATLWQVYATGDGPGGPEGGSLDVLGDLRGIGEGLAMATRDAALAIPGIVGIELADGPEEDATGLAAPLQRGLAGSSGGHPGLAAAALLMFVLLYVPCVATVAAIRHELGGRWALLSVTMNLAIAWLAATAVFQGGRAISLLLGGG